MTVVVWMKRCAFCGHGHWTDQECIVSEGENETRKKKKTSKDKVGI